MSAWAIIALIVTGGYQMKVITFAAIKGGVGKTTLTFNYAEWLAKKGQKVLLIDLDHQCNLTQCYNIYESKNTIANAFKGGDVDIKQVKENISLKSKYEEILLYFV